MSEQVPMAGPQAGAKPRPATGDVTSYTVGFDIQSVIKTGFVDKPCVYQEEWRNFAAQTPVQAIAPRPVSWHSGWRPPAE